MSWVAQSDEPATFDALLERCPELLDRYRAFYRSFWSEGLVPRRILELTRLRIAAIHGCPQEWEARDAGVALSRRERESLRNGDFSAFTEDEQALLSLAELIPFAHHQISDNQVAELSRRLGPSGTVAALTALAIFDARCRLEIVLDAATAPGPLTAPSLQSDGPA